MSIANTNNSHIAATIAFAAAINKYQFCITELPEREVKQGFNVLFKNTALFEKVVEKFIRHKAKKPENIDYIDHLSAFYIEVINRIADFDAEKQFGLIAIIDAFAKDELKLENGQV